jgi:lipoate synthase
MGDLVFPSVCDQCGAPAVMPCHDGTVVRATFMVLGLRCGSCARREHVEVTMGGVTLMRKPDRRGKPVPA